MEPRLSDMSTASCVVAVSLPLNQAVQTGSAVFHCKQSGLKMRDTEYVCSRH